MLRNLGSKHIPQVANPIFTLKKKRISLWLLAFNSKCLPLYKTYSRKYYNGKFFLQVQVKEKYIRSV